MFINMKISSKNQNSLKQYLELIFKLSNFYDLDLRSVLRCFSQRSRRKVLTILKSPHVNKASQEQFESNLKSKLVGVGSYQFFKFLILTKKLQNLYASDVSVIVKFNINNDVLIENLFSQLLLQNYRIKTYNEIATIKYLKLLDLHGFSKFNIV